MQKDDYKNASVGINIIELGTGESVFELNPEKMLVPASTMKLITSATAFEILGADYKFETKIGYSGKLAKNGELNGDLVIVGGADPALGSEYFPNHYIGFLKKLIYRIV